MRLFRRLKFRLVKQDTAGNLLRRVHNALRAGNIAVGRMLFHLEDGAYSKVSASRRAIKQFPQLEPFRFTKRERGTNEVELEVARLSNLAEGWQDANPRGAMTAPPLEVLAEIGDRIPRSFPFLHASFVFDEVEWFGGPPTPAVSQGDWCPHSAFHIGESYRSSMIALRSDWWTSRREVALIACIEIDPPDFHVAALPGLPPALDAVLAAIGKISGETLEIELTDDERKLQEQASDGLTGLGRRFSDLLEGEWPSDWVVPHRLTPIDQAWALHHERQMRSGGNPLKHTIPPKAAISEAFKPLGYKYQSKRSVPGVNVVTKRTAANHELEVFCDYGSYSEKLSASFGVNGPLGNISLGVPAISNLGKRGNYPLIDGDTYGQAMENVAAIVARLESSFVPAAETMLGPAPAWFRYGP